MFQFKQFSINQSHTAMKVCTDTCLFGALISAENPKNILDIGTGTGVLTLMQMQKYPDAKFTAIELDKGAYQDAEINFKSCTFQQKIFLENTSIQEFAKKTFQKFDLIVCNPPFYENKLKSPNNNINVAHHTETLSFKELAQAISDLKSNNANIWIMLPPFEMAKFKQILSEFDIFPASEFNVRHHENKPIIRQIIAFKSEQTTLKTQEICINEKLNNAYSKRFIELLKDYYLIF